MTKIIGIDDAGRGPVLGPMILAGVLTEKSDEKIIKEWGAKDSKLLTPTSRKLIKNKIISKFKYHVEVSNPPEIDESTNLNYLEAVKTAMIINNLNKNLNEKVEIYVDCPSTNIEAWSNDVQKLIKKPKKVILKCEHKADLNHPIVSAASIIAKEKREDEMFALRRKHKIDFGSGYPGDPKTKDFIKDNFTNKEHKDIIRHSWKTIKNLHREKEQQKLF